MLNTIILRARSASEAIAKAESFGLQQAVEDDTLTIGGKPAEMIFLGLQNIGLLHDGVEDGAEIFWDSRCYTLARAKSIVRNEQQLLKGLQREGVT